jgi:hypothetical protein
MSNDDNNRTGHIINIKSFRKEKPLWPTHLHNPSFWETLGRTVATVGLLEECLAKAIFVITGNKPVSDLENIDNEVKKWADELLKAVSDTLGTLITKFEKAVDDSQNIEVANFKEFINQLRELCVWRNILCHCSWRAPDDEGKSVPLFINRNGDILKSKIDEDTLRQVMNSAAELSLEVINTITANGFQWPGSNGPGKPTY